MLHSSLYGCVLQDITVFNKDKYNSATVYVTEYVNKSYCTQLV